MDTRQLLKLRRLKFLFISFNVVAILIALIFYFGAHSGISKIESGESVSGSVNTILLILIVVSSFDSFMFTSIIKEYRLHYKV